MGTNFFNFGARRNMMTQPEELRTAALPTTQNAMFPTAQTNRGTQFNAMQNFGQPVAPGVDVRERMWNSGQTSAPANPAMTMRVNPNYLPETWDYTQSPEYQQRLAWAQRDLNRQLLAMGRSDSTGGINAMARQQAEIAGQEIDKQYQRAINANMENYNRMFGANQVNYGRAVGEDETGWNRAWNLGEQDWNRNWQLANLGFDATRTGVSSGNQTGLALADLLSGNGANQASLALRSGAVSADQIQGLLNAGWTYLQIEQLIGQRGGGGGVSIPSSVNVPQAPTSGIYNPSTLPQGQVPSWLYQTTDYFS